MRTRESHNQFDRLPEELLQDIFDRLDKNALLSVNLTSRWGYSIATRRIWEVVELTDCRTPHEDGVFDDHDDTPLIKKLLVLATNPWLASCVQVLTHRCHLPPPAPFEELPYTPFTSQTLSIDPRTIHLAKLAVNHMTRVHTLRIIFGHPTLTDALLRCFFNINRTCESPIRRLWLENCRISVGCQLRREDSKYALPIQLSFQGLQSLRLRRLPLRPGADEDDTFPAQYTYARGDSFIEELQDGAGRHHKVSMNWFEYEQTVIHHMNEHQAYIKGLIKEQTDDQLAARPHEGTPFDYVYRLSLTWDDQIYERLAADLTTDQKLLMHSFYLPSHYERGILASRGRRLDPLETEPTSPFTREQKPTSMVGINLLNNCSQSLTSLTLDWLFTMPTTLWHHHRPGSQQRWLDLFIDLFTLRFPHLRAFQLRSVIDEKTRLPQGLYLFDRAKFKMPSSNTFHWHIPAASESQKQRLDTICLDFMEAHPNLQCLAWPMDHFFSEEALPADIAIRVQAVVENLGRKLIELRIDALFHGVGELQSEDFDCQDYEMRDRRRRFIEGFASKMERIQVIKIEGGVPRDERRETLRALHSSPVRKIVLIGVNCTLGNTWGEDGGDLIESIGLNDVQQAGLEAEDKDAIWKSGAVELEPPSRDKRFQATYGWPPGPPMANIIAAYHGNTVTELKFAGYRGAPLLLSPTPITSPMLSGLKHFDKLERLTISFWLTTTFEDRSRDEEIISYWQNARSPSSTALVQITDEAPGAWEQQLLTKYEPMALARRITSFIGPFLSNKAKSRPKGVCVRASFCLGIDDAREIYDVDLRIQRDSHGNDICMDHIGPRPEIDPERRQSKLDNRGWF